MTDRLLLDGFGMLYMLVLALSIWYVVKGFISRYKATNDAILKTHITVHELQKMIESRRVCRS